MADARSFSINDVIVSLDGTRVSGLSDSDPIKASLAGDDTSAKSGCNGDVAISYLNNNVAELTLKLMQTSPDNGVLSDKCAAILNARRGSIAIEVFDSRGLGTILSMPQAAPKKRSDIGFAPEAGDTEWVFHGLVGAWDVRGNELA